MVEQKPMSTKNTGALVNVGGRQIAEDEAHRSMDAATLAEVNRNQPGLQGQALIDAYAKAHHNAHGEPWQGNLPGTQQPKLPSGGGRAG